MNASYFFSNMRFFASAGFLVFLFLFIFGMPTPIGSLTPLLTLGVIAWGVVYYKKNFLYMPKAIFYLFIFLLFDLLVSLIIPIILSTYDFSIIQTKVNFFVSILATYFLAKYMLDQNISSKKFFNLLLKVFVLQSILIVGMLLNSELSQSITSFTRDSDQGMRVLDTYSGARGLGVADSSAFGLAIVMGFFIFLSFFAYKNKYINFYFFIFLLLIGVVASISAGRTAMLGLFFGGGYLFFNAKNLRAFIMLVSTLLIVFCVGYVLLNVEQTSIKNETLALFYSYSMEPILNYTNTGGFSSTSTDALQDMYFPLTEQQFLLGDGRYTDGVKYYLSTDAGYMRFVLFYGAFFSFLLYAAFALFVLKVVSINKKYTLLCFMLLIFSFILHYKGEVILFAVSYNKVLFLILFYILSEGARNKKAL
ncbi:hypothetical protein [Acinetobacter vivianii]|uniref:hypothetical protein n=1 Tax=Acinetobacter vivianii TaxID=1776742 RepID=UPI002DBA300E|nr:hypothetical protein [Acinetobacter vivianii]MEB6481020.1 hypothetical protein [Acinetobacter vivianii]MEB6659304.1 hypothetical protein [Acinetobacter vivianii]